MNFAPMPNWANQVNNVAVRSGLASDATVWTRPPVDGDWLGIPSGVTITC